MAARVDRARKLALETLSRIDRVEAYANLQLPPALARSNLSERDRAFVTELVPPEHLLNAVTLTAAQANAARAIGPAIGGVVLGTLGNVRSTTLKAFPEAAYREIVASLG